MYKKEIKKVLIAALDELDFQPWDFIQTLDIDIPENEWDEFYKELCEKIKEVKGKL